MLFNFQREIEGRLEIGVRKHQTERRQKKKKKDWVWPGVASYR